MELPPFICKTAKIIIVTRIRIKIAAIVSYLNAHWGAGIGPSTLLALCSTQNLVLDVLLLVSWPTSDFVVYSFISM